MISLRFFDIHALSQLFTQSFNEFEKYPSTNHIISKVLSIVLKTLSAIGGSSALSSINIISIVQTDTKTRRKHLLSGFGVRTMKISAC